MFQTKFQRPSRQFQNTVAGFVQARPSLVGSLFPVQVKPRQLSAEREVSQLKLHLRPPFFGGQRGPTIPTKIKVCGEPSWGVRESLFQIRVQIHEQFRRLSLTYLPTNKQTNIPTQIQLHVYII